MPAPTAEELDSEIRRLVVARASLGALPQEPAPNPCANALMDPSWNTFPDLMSGVCALQFHHPAFGWLTFALPKRELERLVPLLTEQLRLLAITPPPPATTM